MTLYKLHHPNYAFLSFTLLCLCAQSLSHVQVSAAWWTKAHQAPLSMKFSGWKYWGRLPFPPSRESSCPRDGTHISCVSCIGRQILITELPGKPIPFFILLQSLRHHWMHYIFFAYLSRLWLFYQKIGSLIPYLTDASPSPWMVSGNQKPLSNTCWMNHQRQMSLLSECLYSNWRRHSTNKKTEFGGGIEMR